MLRFVWLNAAAPEVKECYALRQAVFVEEQGFKEEFDDLDARCEHLLALEGNMPVVSRRRKLSRWTNLCLQGKTRKRAWKNAA